jgi:two-component system NarL family sensor kinase
MGNEEARTLIIVITLIFLIAPAFLLVYIFVYNRRKKKHIEEKEQMKENFEAEIVKTQLEIQEQTIQTIGADLHDNIGQLLSLTSLTLGSIELGDTAKTQEKIDAAIDLTGRSIKEMRLLGKLLQGEQLISMGLADAIRHEIQWVERSGQYIVNCVIDEEMPVENSPDKDLIIFRILQETLNNIIKHAGAKHINIKLRYIGRQLILYISDDGNGFDVADQSGGIGLYNIRKRAEIVGGQVVIESARGEGTGITIFIPYP